MDQLVGQLSKHFELTNDQISTRRLKILCAVTLYSSWTVDICSEYRSAVDGLGAIKAPTQFQPCGRHCRPTGSPPSFRGRAPFYMPSSLCEY